MSGQETVHSMCVDTKELANTSKRLQEEFIWVHTMFEICFSYVKLNFICITGSSLTMKHACIIGAILLHHIFSNFYLYIVKINRNVNIITTCEYSLDSCYCHNKCDIKSILRIMHVCVCLCLLPLTLHRLDEALDGVWSDTESSTLLHQDRRDVAVHVQVVNRLRLQAQRVHELSAGRDKSAHSGPSILLFSFNSNFYFRN